ncbi:MAG TPA: flavin reductase family protein [Syntrophales bacterium]|nr:flavin reductase family protein [Syntrophales bacterium]
MKIEMIDLTARETHDLLTGVISPLPIALISTVGEDGIYNAAPFSLVTPVSWKPPIVLVSIGARGGLKKDTLRNIEFSKDFVINIMGEDSIKPAIAAAGNYPGNVDEIKEVGLNAIAAERVRAPLISEAQISIECELYQKMELSEGENFMSLIFGEVVLVHMKDGIWESGEVHPSALKAVGRLGNNIYCRTSDSFSI